MKDFFNVVLDTLNVKHSKSFIDDLLDNHNFDNSMYSIQNFLGNYNIKTEGVRYSEIPNLKHMCPFIANIEHMWALVISVTDSVVKYVNVKHGGQIQEISLSIFEERWNKRALLIKSYDKAAEPNYIKYKQKDKISRLKFGIVVISSISLVVACLFNNKYISFPLYITALTLNGVGLILSLLLLKKQLHQPSKLGDKLCSIIENHECETVIESADFFGIAKFGEIGFGYFFTNIAFLLIAPKYVLALSLIAICVLPFSFWSIWFQKYRVREWCMLCLLSLSTMWLQAIGYLLFGLYRQPISYSIVPYLVTVGTTYVLIILFINWIVKYIAAYQEKKAIQKDYNRVLSDKRVSEAIMPSSVRFDISEENCSSIIFGDKDAKHRITVFSNPYCGPCAAIHEKLMKLPQNLFQIQFVMTYFSEEKKKANMALIAAYRKFGADKSWKIFTDWFEEGTYIGQDFFNKYNLNL
ncbi:MAG: hypothetical protein HDR45_06240, partial [Bacteroides sp.]|nr:hypothetical protein [Bacteroides sp.]